MNAVICFYVIMLSTISSTLSYDNFISGGNKAESGQFPFFVDLWDVYLGQGGCGGSILNDETVLTSLKCVEKNDGWNYTHVRAGVVEEKSENESLFAIDQIVKPEEGSLPKLSDLAMIKLKDKIVFNKNIKHIDLIYENFKVPLTLKATNVGRGFPDRSYLKYLHLYVNKCKNFDETGYFCLFSDSGSSCLMDHGSPYFITVNNKYFQIGLVSDTTDCGPNFENLSSDIASPNNYKWIIANM